MSVPRGGMNVNDPLVSAVVRARDKAGTVGETIGSVVCQTIPTEVIVVDSGSRDATLEIARDMGATIVSIPGDSFTYGGAINAGIVASRAEYVLILSAHCALPDRRWLQNALRHFADTQVVGVNGVANHRARRRSTLSAEQRLTIGASDDVVTQDRPIYSFRGFSNSCSLVRKSTCQQFPFNEELLAAEDKEWANRVTQAGFRIVFDPTLGVLGVHRRKEGYRSLYRRARKESAVLTDMLGEPAWTVRKTSQYIALIFGSRSGVMRLAAFHPANLVEYAGRISGARRARRP